MSMRFKTAVTDITALPPAGTQGTITIKVPGDIRLHELLINVQQGQSGSLTTPAAATRAQIETAIKDVRINNGTKLLRVASGAQINTINAFNGYTLKDGILALLFSESWRATVMAEEVTAWDLFGTRGLTIDIDVLVPASGTFFNITVQRKWDKVPNVDTAGRFIGRYVIWKRISENLTQGVNTRDTWPKELPYNRIHIFAATGASKISRSIVRLENNPLLDVTNTAEKPEYDESLTPMKFAKQTGHYAIMSDDDQQIQSFVPVGPASEHQVELTTTAVDTPTIIVEQQTDSIR
jgi:hypothetical protein